jgi:hypothetical protein
MRSASIIGLRAIVAASLVSVTPPTRISAGQAPSSPSAAWTVTIVLPPRVMAGHPATLAVFGADGKLASGVNITIDGGQMVTTDRTGHATFTAPAGRDYMLAKGSGAAVAALVDPATGASEPAATTAPPVISRKDRFWVCTAGLRGEADADNVWINEEPALVLAASPECLVAVPSLKAAAGPATIRVEAPGTQASVKTTLVDLAFDAPRPSPVPGKGSRLEVRVRGTDEKLGLVVNNLTPNVLKFAEGDSQEVLTKGGADNVATIDVRAIRSGDYSFRARLIADPDISIAWRYLSAAALLAPKERQNDIRVLAKRVERKPRDAPGVRAQIAKIVTSTIDGDFRTLMNAAWEAL